MNLRFRWPFVVVKQVNNGGASAREQEQERQRLMSESFSVIKEEQLLAANEELCVRIRELTSVIADKDAQLSKLRAALAKAEDRLKLRRKRAVKRRKG